MLKTHSAKGFTMIELVVVLIIIGLLSTFGFTQYLKMIESGRKAEAKSTLGSARTYAVSRQQEIGSYPTDLSGIGLPTDCAGDKFFFSYSIAPATGIVTAARCTTGGKPPPNQDPYTLTLAPDGTTGGTGVGGGW